MEIEENEPDKSTETVCSDNSFNSDVVDITNIDAATSSTNMDNSISSMSGTRKHRNRKRKRELYRKIREQIAYYFSDSNLRHDKFMRKLVAIDQLNSNSADVDQDKVKKETDKPSESDGSDSQNKKEEEFLPGTKPVPLSIFLTFNKILNLTKDEQDLVNAFKYDPSDSLAQYQLVFDEKCRLIYRSEPFYFANTASDANERTIYLEGFSFDAQDDVHNRLRQMFEQFGQILSVRTPRYRNSKQIMGFAFIEFKDKFSVEQSCKHFDRSNKICSLKAATLNQVGLTNIIPSETESPLSDFPNKMQQKQELIEEKQKIFEKTVQNCDCVHKTTETESTNCDQTSQHTACDMGNQMSLGSSCELNCMDTAKEAEKPSSSKTECEKSKLNNSNKLRVIPKIDWIRYKNSYLSLQRKTLSILRVSMNNRDVLNESVRNSFALMPPDGQQNVPKHSRQCIERDKRKPSKCHNDHPFVSKASENRSEGDTISGPIVQIEFLMQCGQDVNADIIRKALRNVFDSNQLSMSADIPTLKDIAYIDVPPSSIEFNEDGSSCQRCYIRTHSLEAAYALVGDTCQNYLRANLLVGQCQITNLMQLNDHQVAQYWQTFNNCKRNRFKRQRY